MTRNQGRGTARENRQLRPNEREKGTAWSCVATGTAGRAESPEQVPAAVRRAPHTPRLTVLWGRDSKCLSPVPVELRPFVGRPGENPVSCLLWVPEATPQPGLLAASSLKQRGHLQRSLQPQAPRCRGRRDRGERFARMLSFFFFLRYILVKTMLGTVKLLREVLGKGLLWKTIFHLPLEETKIKLGILANASPLKIEFKMKNRPRQNHS